VDTWLEILKNAPYIAMILGLGLTTILLYKSREKDRKEQKELQAEYRENLVQATSALNELASEHLKQAFADSAAWQDRLKSIEDAFKQHMQDDLAADGRIETKLNSVHEEFSRHEGRMREFVKDHVGQVADRSMEQFERAMRTHRN
jgi:hypothetical protein